MFFYTWNPSKSRGPLVAPALTRRCCMEALSFITCRRLSSLGMISRCFMCVPNQREATFIGLFFSFLTSLSLHLLPQMMTVLIRSQAINFWKLQGPILPSARSSRSPGCNSLSCSHRDSCAVDTVSVLIPDDDCTNSFTPNQVARMHCYLDLVYQSWQPAKKPAPIAIAPQIVARTSASVTLEWFPPIDGHFFERWSHAALYSCTPLKGKGRQGSSLGPHSYRAALTCATLSLG